MELNIEINPIEKFEVKVNGVAIGEFEKDSSWEGFVKMKDKNGAVIIASDERSIVDKMFNGLFDKEKQSEFSVVKITPSLIPTDS